MYITTGKAARLCGVHVNTIKGWIRKGALPAMLMPSGHWRITKKAFLEFLNEYDFPVPDELRHREKRSRILIVDDDPVSLDFAQAAMESAPFVGEVHTAEDGYSGLIKIGQLKPQLLVLDIMMPGINGLELIRRLREQPDLTGDMRILVLTGAKDRRLVVHRLREAAPDAVLFKPVTVEQLLGSAAQLLAPDGNRGGATHAATR